ncbi:MAG: hypothetical protein ACI9KS_002900, partial [Sulfitobacter sp.]
CRGHIPRRLHGASVRSPVMTDTPQLLLAHHLKSLRLPTFLREYDKVAKQCAAEGIDHSRYLLRLAELELIDRERRMVERRIHCLAGDVHITEKGGCKVPGRQKPRQLRLQAHALVEQDAGHGAGPL